MYMQEEYERRLLTLCDEGIVDEKEVLYLLSQPIVKLDLNTYDEVNVYNYSSHYHRSAAGLIATSCWLINCMTLLFHSQYGRTSLWHACYHGRIDLVRILIEYGADVNLPTDVSLSILLVYISRCLMINYDIRIG